MVITLGIENGIANQLLLYNVNHVGKLLIHTSLSMYIHVHLQYAYDLLAQLAIIMTHKMPVEMITSTIIPVYHRLFSSCTDGSRSADKTPLAYWLDSSVCAGLDVAYAAHWV